MAQSARGLFKATGNKARREVEREPLDFQPTPLEPFLALAQAERGELARFDTLWEPACGDGRMARQMRAAGFKVAMSDIVDRGCHAIVRNFYDFKRAPAPAIITNPPFQECNSRDGKGRWIKHALDELGVDYMALLLNWNWPAANGLGTLVDRLPLARVYLMRWKIDFTGEGAPPMNCGWFIWDREWKGETVLRFLDRVDVRQPSLLDMEEMKGHGTQVRNRTHAEGRSAGDVHGQSDLLLDVHQFGGQQEQQADTAAGRAQILRAPGLESWFPPEG